MIGVTNEITTGATIENITVATKNELSGAGQLIKGAGF
jgi:hypothetical protein